jgi:hypothetical protein
MIKTTCLLILLFACLSFWGYGQNKSYQAGYRELQFTDSLRRYQPLTSAGNRLYYRPVHIDCWYPTEAKTKNALDYRYFLSLFERRANGFQTETQYDSVATEMLSQFTGKASVAPAKLLTHTLPNVKPAAGQFPIIVYLCAYNGMSYENVALFEQLAQAGYYLISVSSVGRYPGNMSTHYEDALEQARDAAFAIGHANTNVADTSQIGVISYSYGSLAGILLAHQIQNLRCFLSLDGSEKHYYGQNRQEDSDFDDCRSKANLTLPSGCPYAYLESDHKAREGKIDSIFVPTATGKHFYGRLADAEHEDFSYISMLGNTKSLLYPQVLTLAKSYNDQMLKGKTQLFEQQLKCLLNDRKAFANPEPSGIREVTIKIAGKITDVNHQPLPYVSIGILTADAGTISQADGSFLLTLNDSLQRHLARISAIGYQSVTLPVNQLSAIMTQHGAMTLVNDVHELPAVSITANRPHFKTVGSTSHSRFFSVGFPFADLGSEVGVILPLGKQNVLLQSFNYHISYNRMDSCTFRLNIYAVKNGLPAQNLLSQNIITRIGHQAGNYNINLQPYRLLLQGDVCVALEWIAGTTKTKNSAVFFSGGLLSSSFHRKAAQGRWVKLKGMGAGFNLKVQKPD